MKKYIIQQRKEGRVRKVRKWKGGGVRRGGKVREEMEGRRGEKRRKGKGENGREEG